MKGEREAGNRVTREVGNVASDTEITFQFGARQHGSQGEGENRGMRTSQRFKDWGPSSQRNTFVIFFSFPDV